MSSFSFQRFTYKAAQASINEPAREANKTPKHVQSREKGTVPEAIPNERERLGMCSCSGCQMLQMEHLNYSAPLAFQHLLFRTSKRAEARHRAAWCGTAIFRPEPVIQAREERIYHTDQTILSSTTELSCWFKWLLLIKKKKCSNHWNQTFSTDWSSLRDLH